MAFARFGPRAPGIRRMAGTGMGGDYRIASRFAPSRRNSLHVSRPDPNPSMPMPMNPKQEHNYQRREQHPSYYEPWIPEHIGHDPLFMRRHLREEKPLHITRPEMRGHDPAFLKKYLKKYGTPYR